MFIISFVSTSIFASSPKTTIIRPVTGQLHSSWGIGGSDSVIEYMTGPINNSAYKITVHVNKYNSNNPSLINDPVEFVCFGTVFKIKPGDTGPTCEVNIALPAYIYINPRDFHNGTDGTGLSNLK